MIPWFPPTRHLVKCRLPTERPPSQSAAGSITAPSVTRSPMPSAIRCLALALCLTALFAAGAHAEEAKPYNGPACTRAVDEYFAKEVWAKVGAVWCVQCHKKGGDAEESKLVLQDPRKLQGHAQDDAMRHN